MLTGPVVTLDCIDPCGLIGATEVLADEVDILTKVSKVVDGTSWDMYEYKAHAPVVIWYATPVQTSSIAHASTHSS